MFMCCAILWESQLEVRKQSEAEGAKLRDAASPHPWLDLGFWRTYILKAPDSLVDIARGVFV